MRPEKVSPRAAAAGRAALAEVVPDDDVEAVPLGTFALGVGAVADELGVRLRSELLSPASVPDSALSVADPALGLDEAAVLRARIFRARDPAERRRFCWRTLEALATDDPSQALTQHPACWLLILEGVEDALRRGAPASSPGSGR